MSSIANLLKNAANAINKVANTASKPVKKSSAKRTSSSVKKGTSSVKSVAKKGASAAKKAPKTTPNYWGSNTSKQQRDRLRQIQQQQLKEQAERRKREEEKRKKEFAAKQAEKKRKILENQMRRSYTQKVEDQFKAAEERKEKRLERTAKSASKGNFFSYLQGDITGDRIDTEAPLRVFRNTKDKQDKKKARPYSESYRQGSYADTLRQQNNYPAVSNVEMKQMDFHAQTAYRNGNTQLGDFILQTQAAKEAYNQVVRGVMPSKEFEDKNVTISNILSDWGRYGISDNDMASWAEQNCEWVRNENGQMELRFKGHNFTPLYGYDVNGNYTDLSYYFKSVYMSGEALENQTVGYDNYLKSMASNPNDTSDETINSFSDFIRSGFIFNGDAISGYFGHLKNHYLRPFLAGKWQILGSNLLVDLGETLDLPSLGLKALIKSKPYVYGRDEAFVDGQQAWVSSIGEEKQKRLIDAGALDTISINPVTGMKQRFGIFRDFTDEELYAIGLTREEYEQFKEEYEAYNEWSLERLGNGIETIKEAYTSHDTYNVDTGNVFIDFLSEMILDPTILIGTPVRSGLKTSAKTIGSEAVERGLKETINKSVKDFVGSTVELNKMAAKSGANRLDPIMKQFTRKLQDSMYTTLVRNGRSIKVLKASDRIQNEVNALTKRLVATKTLPADAADAFGSIVHKAIMSERDRLSFNVVKGLHYMDRAEEMFEGALLKGIFIAPYASIKIPKTIVKGVKNTPVGRFAGTQIVKLRQRALKSITEKLTGSLFDVDEFEEVLDKTYFTDIDEGFKVQQQLRKRKVMEQDFVHFRNNMNQILDAEIKATVEDVSRFTENVNNEIRRITNGRYSTLAEFKTYLKNVDLEQYSVYRDIFESYAKYLDDITEIVENKGRAAMIKTQYEFLSKLARSQTNQDLSEALLELNAAKGSFPYLDKSFDEVVDDINTLFATAANDVSFENALSKVRSYAQKWKDKQIEFKRTSDKNVATPSALRSTNIDVFASRTILKDSDVQYSVVNASTDLNKYVQEVLRKVDGSIDDFPVLKRFGELADSVKAWLRNEDSSPVVVGELISVSEGVLRELNYNAIKYPDIPYQRLFEEVKFIRNKLTSRYEVHRIREGANLEFIRFQRDKQAATLDYFEDSTMQKVFSDLSSNDTAIGRVLNNLSTLLDDYPQLNSVRVKEIASQIDDTKLSKVYDMSGGSLDMSRFYEVLKDTEEGELVKQLIQETNIGDPVELIALIKMAKQDDVINVLDALSAVKAVLNKKDAAEYMFNRLKNELDEKVYMLTSSALYHFTTRTPDALINTGSSVMDQLMNNIELLGDTLYGGESVALDKFRIQALNFNHSMYDRYADELIANPALKGRIERLLSNGHINPIDDVNATMLQAILKDKDTITKYNERSLDHDVFFTDIETLGFNARVNGITAIAMKKWTPIDENASLSEILDMIEGSEDIVKSVKLSDEAIENVSDSILELNFKNDPTVYSSRTERLKAYADMYGAKGGEEYTEKELLDYIMGYLDNSYDARAGHVPELVFHNNNGFDQNFLMARAQNPDIAAFTSSIPHLNVLMRQSSNILKDLKIVTGSPTLTLEEQNIIKNIVSEYASNSLKDSTNLIPFEGNRLKYTLNDLERALNKLDVNHVSGIDELSYLFANKAEFDELNALASEAIESIQDKHRAVRASIVLNPNQLDITKVDDRFIKNYMSEEEFINFQNSVARGSKVEIEMWNKIFKDKVSRKMFSADTEKNLLKFIYNMQGEGDVISTAWKKFFSQAEVSNYFDLGNGFYSKNYLHKAQQFTNAVDVKLNKFLKYNRHIEGHKEEFQVIIKYFKDKAASNLDEWDDLYFLKDLKIPETLNEAYIIAQEIWTRVTGGWDYDEIFRYMSDNTPYSKIPQKLRTAAATMTKFELGSDTLASLASIEVRHILDDYKGIFHRDIFINVKGGTDFVDLEDVLEEDELLQAFINRIHDTLYQVDGINLLTRGVDEADMKANAVRNALHDTAVGVTKWKDLTITAKRQFLNSQKKLKRWQRNLYSHQMLDHFLEAGTEKNLVAHLLHHKGVLVVAIQGDLQYMAKVKRLRDLIDNEGTHLYAVESQGQLWIGIKQEYLDSIRVVDDSTKKVDSVAQMYFQGEGDRYEAPRYKAIPMQYKKGENVFNIEDMDNLLQKNVDKIVRLSNGDSLGSLNQIYNMRMHQNLYKNAPAEFLDNTLPLEVTLNARFWHQPAFDFNRIGGEDYYFKLNDVNDKDIIIQHYEVVKEMAERTSAERLFIEDMMGRSELKSLRAPFSSDMTSDEIAKAITENDDVVVVALRNSLGASKSGYWVEEVSVPDGFALDMAEEEGAVLMNYSTFIMLDQLINKNEFSNTFLSAWSQMMRYFKAGQLCNIGTWTRNYFDATMKSTLETGSLTDTFTWQLQGLKVWQEYQRISKVIENTRTAKFSSDLDLRRNWDTYMKKFYQEFKTEATLTYEDYKVLSGFYGTVGGGQSRFAQSKIDFNTKRGRARKFLRGSEEGDLIAESMELFKTLDDSQIERLWNKTKGLDTKGFTFESFIDTWHTLVNEGENALDNAVKARLNEAVDQMLEYGALEMRGTRDAVKDTFDGFISKMFTPMGVPEEVIRTGLLLQLKSEGFTYDGALRRIVAAQFSGPQSVFETYISLALPFYSFMKDNLLYWVKKFTEDPRKLRILLNAWDELSFQDGMPTPEEYASGQIINDALTDGSINLWEGEDAKVKLKLNPSFLDAISWFYNTPDSGLKALNTPMQFMLTEALYDRGAMDWGMFSDTRFLSFVNGRSFGERVAQNLPIVGPVISNVKSQYEIYQKLSEGHSFLEVLLSIPTSTSLLGVTVWDKFAPDVFSDDFAGFLARLEKQGKWWDPKQGKVVPLSQRYQHNLSWEEIRLQQAGRGMFWDANQQAFVRLSDYIVGGLNKVYDFSQEGEWEEFCKWRKYYLGEIWDANQRKFVKPEDYIDGGLNNPNLSWDNICAFYEMRFGLVWDSNRGAWVSKSEAIQGGLNRKDLSWEELTALKLALHGEVWDYNSRKWIKVQEPIVKISEFHDIKWSLDEGLVGLTRDMTYTLTGYAKQIGDMASLRSGQLPERGLVLTGNPEHDKMVFDYILSSGIGQKGVYNYSSGYANGYWFNKRSVYPKWNGYKQYTYNKKKYKNKPPMVYSNKTYGNAFNFNGNAGLRMATSNKTAYDDYYRYSYKYSYNFRVNPYFTTPASYPDTSSWKNRSGGYRIPLSKYRVIRGAMRT